MKAFYKRFGNPEPGVVIVLANSLEEAQEKLRQDELAQDLINLLKEEEGQNGVYWLLDCDG